MIDDFQARPLFRVRNRPRWGWVRKGLAALAITWVLLLLSYLASFLIIPAHAP